MAVLSRVPMCSSAHMPGERRGREQVGRRPQSPCSSSTESSCDRRHAAACPLNDPAAEAGRDDEFDNEVSRLLIFGVLLVLIITVPALFVMWAAQ